MLKIFRNLEVSCVAKRECPPISKKSFSMPTCVISKTSFQIPAAASSRGFLRATNSVFNSESIANGSGRAFRSILSLEVMAKNLKIQMMMVSYNLEVFF